MKWSFLMVFLFGCGPRGVGHAEFTTKKPLEKDLVGKYVPTAATVRFIKEQGNYPEAKTSIILSKDGTFEFHNVPDWWNTDFGKPNGRFDSGSGTWDVTHQNWYRVGLSFTSTEGFHSAKYNNQLGTSILIVGDKSPYLLHLTVGDFDAGDAMQFEKVADGK